MKKYYIFNGFKSEINVANKCINELKFSFIEKVIDSEMTHLFENSNWNLPKFINKLNKICFELNLLSSDQVKQILFRMVDLVFDKTKVSLEFILLDYPNVNSKKSYVISDAFAYSKKAIIQFLNLDSFCNSLLTSEILEEYDNIIFNNTFLKKESVKYIEHIEKYEQKINEEIVMQHTKTLSPLDKLFGSNEYWGNRELAKTFNKKLIYRLEDIKEEYKNIPSLKRTKTLIQHARDVLETIPVEKIEFYYRNAHLLKKEYIDNSSHLDNLQSKKIRISNKSKKYSVKNSSKNNKKKKTKATSLKVKKEKPYKVPLPKVRCRSKSNDFYSIDY